jgi:DNA ligase (NAD+)
MDKITRMRGLVHQLDQAARSYYQENQEIMSNLEYDRLYDELVELENETGTILAGSPTQKVGYELLTQLPKEAHEFSMLSLDKTKDEQVLMDWLGDQEGVLSFKLDGLTIVLTYQDGQLIKAVTRGNGTIGEVITNNAKQFKNLPLTIPYKGRLLLRGEAVIRYSDFEAINQTLDVENQYKNPRNLCSGSVRQLNSEITARRHVRFYGFTLIHSDHQDMFTKKFEELLWLQSQGFECVDYHLVTKENIEATIETFAEKLDSNDVASDGLVLTMNDKAYSQSLGVTSKFPKDTMAYKWQDEIKDTVLEDVFWSASRTGLINPVAVFKPVDLEGTQVSRASLHNISILEKLELGIGDTIQVYKANMIIPQIADNLTRSNHLEIPKECPVCFEETAIKDVNDIKVLYCMNSECPAKKVKAYSHFVSRNAMNIDGLSEATLEKLIQLGLIHEYSDLFKLEEDEKKEKIVQLDGFGEKSYQNLVESIHKARKVKLANFIYALGILHVGLSNAKLLVAAFDHDLNQIMTASVEDFEAIEGFGHVIAKSLYDYFQEDKHRQALDHLLNEVELEKVEKAASKDAISGKTFVITGSLEHYENREALKLEIEGFGGKVTGSVSKNTDYLINNDTTSGSSKNKKAKSLDVPIISEEEFRALIE